MLLALAVLRLRPAATATQRCVVLVPGFGGSQAWMRPLRRFLEHHGYAVRDWGMGRNLAGLDLPHGIDKLSEHWPVEQRDHYRDEGSVPYLCDRFAERMDELSEEIGRPVTLVGWSLGGYVCREVARDLPRAVEQVITLGSPVIGGPKYTATARFFAKRGNDLDWVEAVIRQRDARPIPVPITAIYSRSDGVVDWRAMRDAVSPRASHVEVSASHLGMVLNPGVWQHVLRALDDARVTDHT